MNPFVALGVLLVVVAVALVAFTLRSLPRLPFSVRRARKDSAHGFDELLASEYLITTDPHSIVLNEDGSLTTGFVLAGPDATTKTEGALARLVDDMNAVYSSATVGWMYEFQRVRQKAPAPQSDPYEATPTNTVVNAARERGAHEMMQEDHACLLVTYLPPAGVSASMSRFVVRRAANDASAEGLDAVRTGLADLEDGCRSIEGVLKSCMAFARRMTRDALHPDQDELVDVLFKNVNGWSLPGINLPLPDTIVDGLLPVPVALRERIAVQDFDGGLELRYGREYVKVLTLSTFAPRHRARILSLLTQLAIPYRDHTRLITGHPDTMLAHLEQTMNDAADDATPFALFGWKPSSAHVAAARVDRDAVNRLDELANALALHRSRSRVYAWYTRTIEVRSESLAELKWLEDVVTETFRQARFGLRSEDAHAVDAWLATLGGNGHNCVRRTSAHGVTVGDLSNLTDAWRGRESIRCDKCPPGTQPMAWVRRADTLTRFALDLHANEGDVMSALVAGPIGQGKSALVGFILAHFAKSDDARVVGFDYLRSQERVVEMLEGAYAVPGDPSMPARLCPFTALDTAMGRTAAVEWCELTAELNLSTRFVPATVRAQFTEAIEFLASDPDWRSNACITLFLQKLSAPPDVKAVFEQYSASGIYSFFDSTPDETAQWRRQVRVFDTTVLHELKDAAVFPALALLFADVSSELDGRRQLFIIEEAHLSLQNPAMAKRLIEGLRTTRKRHLAIIFILTDLNGIPEATLRILKDQCGTVFATQNPNALSSAAQYGFLGFDEAAVKKLVPARAAAGRPDGQPALRFQYWQLGTDGLAPFVLDLTPEELEVFARGNDADKRRTSAARRDHPDEVPAAIFQAAGLPHAATAWRTARDNRTATALPPYIDERIYA